MSTQEQNKAQTPKPVTTGSHIAPKGHGSGCACCVPPECDEDDEYDEE